MKQVLGKEINYEGQAWNSIRKNKGELGQGRAGKESFPEERTPEFKLARRIYQHKGGWEQNGARTFWAGSPQLSA